MIIDLAYLVVAIMAVVKGLQRGFIIGIFSLLAFIIGLAAALKLSTVVASYLQEATNLPARWMPILAFLLVFAGVVALVNLGAALITKSLDLVMLGPVNRVAGALLYLLIQTIIFSVMLFYIVQLGWIKGPTIEESKVYKWVSPVGPFIIDGIGRFFPLFKDLFQQLQDFFENVSADIPVKQKS